MFKNDEGIFLMKPIQMKSVALATAMLGLAAPAFAQDMCGGIGAGGQWIGGDEASSDISTAGTYQEQMALVLGGNDYVSLFTVSEGTDVRIEAQGRGAGDPLIDVLSSDGGIILSDDDSGGNGAARGELTLDAGTYCVSMQSYDGAPMTAFVRIGRTEHEALTEGVGDVSTTDNAADAVADVAEALPETGNAAGNCAGGFPLGSNAEIAANVSRTDSVDANGYYTFSLSSPMALSITAENEDADPVIVLYEGTDNYIGENDDYDGLNSRLDMTAPLDAGDYCIEMTALNDTSLPITLTMSEYDPAAALADLYARGEAAPPLDGSVAFTALGTLENRIRKDDTISSEVTWYSVDIDAPGLLLVEAISVGGSGDPWVIVYDDLGREVAYNDDAGEGLDSLAAARVNNGTYIIGVGDINEDASGFGRILFERFVSAN
jgi:hypothetical protein